MIYAYKSHKANGTIRQAVVRKDARKADADKGKNLLDRMRSFFTGMY